VSDIGCEEDIGPWGARLAAVDRMCLLERDINPRNICTGCLLLRDRHHDIHDRFEAAKMQRRCTPSSQDLSSWTGNYCRSPVQLTDAQSQGTKVASTVARDGKTEGISRIFL